MKTTSGAFKFAKPTSVTEVKCFQKDIVAQSDNEFKFFLRLIVPFHFKPENRNRISKYAIEKNKNTLRLDH